MGFWSLAASCSIGTTKSRGRDPYPHRRMAAAWLSAARRASSLTSPSPALNLIPRRGLAAAAGEPFYSAYGMYLCFVHRQQMFAPMGSYLDSDLMGGPAILSILSSFICALGRLHFYFLFIYLIIIFTPIHQLIYVDHHSYLLTHICSSSPAAYGQLLAGSPQPIQMEGRTCTYLIPMDFGLR